MRRLSRLALLAAACGAAAASSAAETEPSDGAASTPAKVIAEGKKIAFDRRKGNCLACHAMADGEYPGNIGPPLIGMAARYPDKSTLRAQIWDAQVLNPISVMPPFGRHGILTEEEIDKVTEFVHSL